MESAHVDDTKSNHSTEKFGAGQSKTSRIPTYLSSRSGATTSECPRTLVEINLIRVCGAIRDRKNWWNKIGNLQIVNTWAKEAQSQGVQSTFQYALAEAVSLAEQYSSTVAKPAAAEGTFMRDGLPEGLQDRLVRDVQRLRHEFNPIGKNIKQDGIPETDQIVDVHPFSNGMVIDLVHPGLYAYEKGVSAVIHGGAEVLAAPKWQDLVGTSEIKFEEKVLAPEPSVRNWQNRHDQEKDSPAGLIWLPSEFELSTDGSKLSINSYINNLHPQQHASLYKGIGECFTAVVPLFEAVLSQLGTDGKVNPWPLRIPIPNDGEDGSWWSYPHGRYAAGEPPTEHDEKYQFQEGDDDDAYENKREALACDQEEFVQNFHANVGAILSTPSIPSTYLDKPMPASTFSLRGRPLQVITKIASIELTPSSPRFKGGTWHVEGLKDERIVATRHVFILNLKMLVKQNLHLEHKSKNPHNLNSGTLITKNP